jgi:hypothetical protein
LTLQDLSDSLDFHRDRGVAHDGRKRAQDFGPASFGVDDTAYYQSSV